MEVGNVLSTGLEMPGLNKLVDPTGRMTATRIDVDSEDRKQVARDFESILIHQLLSTMKDTIPESDLEDSSSGQIKGMYWSFMSQAVSDQGGMGLWKGIYESMPVGETAEAAERTEENDKLSDLDERI
jgi:Rod binding domain-containing protein